jgi:hypothetical protein
MTVLPDDVQVIDLSAWAPDSDYDECMALCVKLKLIETLQHGEHDYARLTKAGRNVLAMLMQLASFASDPANRLKES